MKESGVYRTICGFCHAGCGIKVYRNRFGIESVEGDPEHPSNRGYCCPKISGIKELVESEERLRYPLKKTSGGFKRISWDEALDFAAQKLGEIREKYGPGSLVRNMGAPVAYEARDGFVEFMGAFGSPNFTGSSNLCMLPRITAFQAVIGAKPESDFEKTNLIIFWGANPTESNRFGGYCSYNGFNQIIPRARGRGVRMIAIDPVRSTTAAQADDWIRINPGTDAALGLAMINQIIAEGLYDKKFVAEWTHGFDELAAHVSGRSPKWAEALTGIPEDTIIELARLYATTVPSAICEGNGLDMYTNGVDSARVIAILIAITGNFDIPGGNALAPFPIQSALPTKSPLAPYGPSALLKIEESKSVLPEKSSSPDKRIWHEKFKVYRDLPFPAVKESILRNEDRRPRAMIVHHSNPVLIQANVARTKEALEKLDFLLVNDIFMTSTAEVADLILPSTSDYERYGYKAWSSFEGGILAFSRPVADPPGSSRTVFEVEYELAKKLGLHHDYPFHDTESWIEYMLKPTRITFKQLDEEQVIYTTPEIQYRKYLKNGFNTPSRKVEFYSQYFQNNGYKPLPEYSEPGGNRWAWGTDTNVRFHYLARAEDRAYSYIRDLRISRLLPNHIPTHSFGYIRRMLRKGPSMMEMRSRLCRPEGKSLSLQNYLKILKRVLY